MTSATVFLPGDASILEAWELAAAQESPVYLVGTAENVIGTVTRERLEAASRGEVAAAPLSTIVDPAFVHAHPDHPIDVVLERLAQTEGVLPVVSRAEVHRLEGVVTTQSLLGRQPRRATT